MKKNGIVYKVAIMRSYNKNDGYVSLCGGKHSMEYGLGKKYVPEIGDGLFAFANKEDAIQFMKSRNWKGVIFQGTATNIRRIKLMSYVGCCDGPDYIALYWDNKKKHKKYGLASEHAPKGTVLVSSFSCDKIVYSRTVDLKESKIIEKDLE